MSELDELQLHPEVSIFSVERLDADLRRRIDAADTDFAVSRRRSRSPSMLVDDAAASLLERFKTAKTLADAVTEEARAVDLEPSALLEKASGLLLKAIRRGILVAPKMAGEDRPRLEPGDQIAGAEVLGTLQRLEDTEVYLIRRQNRAAVLKWARQENAGLRAQLDRERRALTALKGSGLAPELLEVGEEEGYPFLMLEHVQGVDAEAASRAWFESKDRRRLALQAARLAEAYAALHQAGIVHGDVHPRNVLIERDDTIRLIDFGLAHFLGEAELPKPGGVTLYYSPELAAAELHGAPFVPSLESEQYSLAAMLFRLVFGRHYCDFRLNRRAMLQQVLQDDPICDGVEPPWPAMTSALCRALAKNPAERFPGMVDFAAALVAAAPEPVAPFLAEIGPRFERQCRSLIQDAALDGQWLTQALPAPRASVNFGAAGVAFALCRMSDALENGELLAAADLWSQRARKGLDEPEAFVAPELELAPKMRSAFHTHSGVFWVEGMLAAAQGDAKRQKVALEGFLAACRASPSGGAELALGDAGILLACSTLLVRVADSGSLLSKQLITLGNELAEGLWHDAALGPSPLRTEGYLGMAHGWAGCLFAALQWAQVSSSPLPSQWVEHLDELAALARPRGRGLRWPLRPSQSEGGMTGWCHGSTGYLLLFQLAAEVTGEGRYHELAEGAAWDLWDDGATMNGSLCCGLTGRAYGLLSRHRSTGDSRWRARAEQLADRALRTKQFGDSFRHSLFKGELALSMLAADVTGEVVTGFPCLEEV